MTNEEKIILLSRARSILDSRGSIRLSEVRDLVVRVLDDMVEESCGSIVSRKDTLGNTRNPV